MVVSSCWLSLFVNQLLLAVNDCSCCLFAGYVFPFHYPASNVPTLLVAYRGIPIIVACKPLLLHDSEYYPLQYEPTNHFLFQTTCMISGHAPIIQSIFTYTMYMLMHQPQPLHKYSSTSFSSHLRRLSNQINILYAQLGDAQCSMLRHDWFTNS